MRLNVKPIATARTHEGGPAIPPKDAHAELVRAVSACLLWEDEFYEGGEAIADRISRLAAQVDPEALAALAVTARGELNLRHAPLLLLVALAKSGAGRVGLVADTIETVIQRADELGEFVALYFADKGAKHPLSKQMKTGLARALGKFDEYRLAKYDRAASVRLRDVLFLTHAKPKDAEQEALWKRLAANELATPDTWEVALSGGADKKATFERLLAEGQLGYLALLRNLRNMTEAGCDRALVASAIRARKGAHNVLPFRYVAAWQNAPAYAEALDDAFKVAVETVPRLAGRTAVLVDVSGSMNDKLSTKSDMSRMDAAAALGVLLNGDDVRCFTFSNALVEVPRVRSLAGIDLIKRSQPHQSTQLGAALEVLKREVQFDRLVVITDEQSHDAVGAPGCEHGYMINVASNQNGVGYGKWVRLNGFSERILMWLAMTENQR